MFTVPDARYRNPTTQQKASRDIKDEMSPEGSTQWKGADDSAMSSLLNHETTLTHSKQTQPANSNSFKLKPAEPDIDSTPKMTSQRPWDMADSSHKPSSSIIQNAFTFFENVFPWQIGSSCSGSKVQSSAVLYMQVSWDRADRNATRGESVGFYQLCFKRKHSLGFSSHVFHWQTLCFRPGSTETLSSTVRQHGFICICHSLSSIHCACCAASWRWW